MVYLGKINLKPRIQYCDQRSGQGKRRRHWRLRSRTSCTCSGLLVRPKTRLEVPRWKIISNTRMRSKEGCGRSCAHAWRLLGAEGVGIMIRWQCLGILFIIKISVMHMTQNTFNTLFLLYFCPDVKATRPVRSSLRGPRGPPSLRPPHPVRAAEY